MSNMNSRQEPRDDLPRFLRSNPELAEDLRSLLLNMEPEEVMAVIAEKDDGMQDLVLRLLDNFERGRLPRQAHVVDSDDELVPLTPSSSSEEESKDTKDRSAIHDSKTPASSSRNIQNQDPQVTDNAPRQGHKEGPAESARASNVITLPPEAMREVWAKSTPQRRLKAEEPHDPFLRNLRKLNTKAESSWSSPDLPPLEGPHTETARGYGSCTSSASTSTASFTLFPDRAAAAPATSASQQEGGKRVPKKTHRGTRGGAARRSAAAVQTEAPASVPLMEAARPAEPAREDQQSARGAPPTRQETRQPANTGAQLDDKDLGVSCFLGFCCGVGITWLLFHW